MTRQVLVRPEAKQDIRTAKAWYGKISPQLGRDFTTMLSEAIARIRERPLELPIVHRTFRRILLHRFPYALFFDATANDRIVIVAVLHQARDPQLLQSR